MIQLILLSLLSFWSEPPSLVASSQLDFAALAEPELFFQTRAGAIQDTLTLLTKRYRAQPEIHVMLDQVRFEKGILEISYKKRPDLIDPAHLVYMYAARMAPGASPERAGLSEMMALESELLIKAGFARTSAQRFLQHLRKQPTYNQILAEMPQEDINPKELTQAHAEALFLAEIKRHKQAKQEYAVQLLEPLTHQERIKLLHFLINDLQHSNILQERYLTPPDAEFLAIWWSELQNR